MPHTNRKKKSSDGSSQLPRLSKAKHVKRQNVEDKDGWTHVVGERKLQDNRNSDKTSSAEIGEFSINGVQYIEKTLEEMVSEHESYKKHWEASDACADLNISLLKYAARDIQISNVVFLGLGSLQNLSLHFRRTSHSQLAALTTIISVLGISNVQIIGQDPLFTDLDKSFLNTLGYRTVDDPEAFSLIDSGSLVYAVHCYPDIYDKISIGVHPGMLIGNDLSYVKDLGSFGGEARIQSIETLSQRYDEQVDFPRYNHDFSDTKIYTRKAPATEKS